MKQSGLESRHAFVKDFSYQENPDDSVTDTANTETYFEVYESIVGYNTSFFR